MNLLTLLLATLSPTDPSWPTGDYAGWAYIHGGGDYPLRLHIAPNSEASKAPSIALDSPAENAYLLPTERVRIDGSTLVFERATSDGSHSEYRLTVAGESLRGEVRVDGESFSSLELVRSPEPLPMVPTRYFADCDGTYLDDAGHAILITRWPWGELRMSEFESGSDRTLFALGDDRFFAGPAQYVPSPITQRIAFERDGDDEVIGLVRDAAGQAISYRRSVTHSESLAFESGGLTLHGTLSLPYCAGPHPAIVILGGSSWTTRDTISRDAALFNALGLATLTYDQRGFGESTDGATNDSVCSFEQTAADARAAITALTQHPAIDSSRIGLSGRSRGGWIAPLAAAKSDSAAFLVLFVPPAISPAAQERTRRLAEFSKAGADAAAMRQATEYLAALFERTTSEASWQQFIALRQRLAEQQIAGRYWLDILLGGDSRDSDDYRWDGLNMRYDPLPALENVKCPVLAIFGELDDNVVPAVNVPILEAALRRAGNRDVEIVIASRGNHGLAPVESAKVPLHRYTGACPDIWPKIRQFLAVRGFAKRGE